MVLEILCGGTVHVDSNRSFKGRVSDTAVQVHLSARHMHAAVDIDIAVLFVSLYVAAGRVSVFCRRNDDLAAVHFQEVAAVGRLSLRHGHFVVICRQAV